MNFNDSDRVCLPLVDAEGRVVGVAFMSDLVKEYELPLRAIVMAGGYGTRRASNAFLPDLLLRGHFARRQTYW